ncbi:MAG TPA: hypothetical protein VLM40_04380, partial [Gemmata sp.]|nr:hypothetical protein [Gemmata sp.]
ARAGCADSVERLAADLLASGRVGAASLGTVKYNVACAFAQLAEFGPADRRPEFAARARALLTELLAASYFARPAANAHLDDDTDLNPLRGRADFRAFVAEVRKKHPLPTPVAPPPHLKPEK